MITENEIQWVFLQCKIRYGKRVQLLVLAEEASELASACCRFVQSMATNMSRGDLYSVLGEIADVRNLVEQLKVLFPEEPIERVIEAQRRVKLARLRDRLIKSGSPLPI